MSNYQSVSLSFYNGKFVTGHLFIMIEEKGKPVCDQFIVFTDYKQAMAALRRVEKIAKHAATMKEKDGQMGKERYKYMEKSIVYHKYF